MSRAIVKKPQAYGSGGTQDKTLVRLTCHGASTITSSAGGVINTYFSMDPSTQSDWSDFSSTFDEFRVIGCSIIMAPVQFGVAVSGGLMAVAFDNDSAGNPGSFSAVQQYANSKYYSVVNSTQPVKFTWWRPQKGGETAITWDDVANPSTSLGSLVFYASGLSASTIYVSVATELYIEFRGRR